MLKKQFFFLLLVVGTASSLAMDLDYSLKRKRSNEDIPYFKKLRPNLLPHEEAILNHPNLKNLVESLQQLQSCEDVINQHEIMYSQLAPQALFEQIPAEKIEKQKLLNVCMDTIPLLQGRRNKLKRDCDDHINEIFKSHDRPTIAEAKELLSRILN